MFSSWTWGRLEKRSFLVTLFLLDLGSAGEEEVEFIPLGPGVGWRREAFCQYLFLLDLGSAGEELCHGLIVIVYKLSFVLVFRVYG